MKIPRAWHVHVITEMKSVHRSVTLAIRTSNPFLWSIQAINVWPLQLLWQHSCDVIQFLQWHEMHAMLLRFSSYIPVLILKDSNDLKNEPPHDKTNKITLHPPKTQISLGIRPVWSESSLSARRKLGSLATHWAHGEDSDQTGQMSRLIWVFDGRTATLLVLSWFSNSLLWMIIHIYSSTCIFLKWLKLQSPFRELQFLLDENFVVNYHKNYLFIFLYIYMYLFI